MRSGCPPESSEFGSTASGATGTGHRGSCGTACDGDCLCLPFPHDVTVIRVAISPAVETATMAPAPERQLRRRHRRGLRSPPGFPGDSALQGSELRSTDATVVRRVKSDSKRPATQSVALLSTDDSQRSGIQHRCLSDIPTQAAVVTAGTGSQTVVTPRLRHRCCVPSRTVRRSLRIWGRTSPAVRAETSRSRYRRAF